MKPEEVEKELAKHPNLPAHNKETMRKMLLTGGLEAEWDKFWDNEEVILKDSNRYHDDN